MTCAPYREVVPGPLSRSKRALRGAASRAAQRGVGVRRGLPGPTDSIALTFDDGPDPDIAPAFLDELRRLGIRATFFVVGHRARARPDLVRRALDEGHAVGSHSDTHPEPWTVPLRALSRDYRRGRQAAEHALGRRVRLFRPPKGHLDGAGAAAVIGAGVRPWLWTVDPGDWRPDVTTEEIVAGLDGLTGGDVVLLHDAIEGPLAPSALDRSATLAALPAIAEVAASRGLRFTTLA
jgi:peptidoglycan/xylan/chitin deacetylase (PgdA/CDA1 family)